MGEKKHDFTGMSQDQKTVGGVSLTNITVIEYVFFYFVLSCSCTIVEFS